MISAYGILEARIRLFHLDDILVHGPYLDGRHDPSFAVKETAWAPTVLESLDVPGNAAALQVECLECCGADCGIPALASRTPHCNIGLNFRQAKHEPLSHQNTS